MAPAATELEARRRVLKDAEDKLAAARKSTAAAAAPPPPKSA
jgi:hypothetical protein